jgi:hypothetical protein
MIRKKGIANAHANYERSCLTLTYLFKYVAYDQPCNS